MDGSEKCGGELAWVEAVLIEEGETVVAGVECGKEVGEVFEGEFVACVGDVGRDGLQGGAGLEGDANAGENVEAVEEVGIE